MGFFSDERVEYLETERQKLWEKVNYLGTEIGKLQVGSTELKNKASLLEDALNKKTSDYEAEAKQSSDRASEYENNSKLVLDSVNNHLNEVNLKVDEISNMHNTVSGFYAEISKNSESVHIIKDEVDIVFASINTLHENLTAQAKELETIYTNRAAYIDKVSKLEDLYSNGNDLSNKIDQFYKSVLGKNEQIEKLHLSIVGYTDKDDKGEDVKVPGLKDKLEAEYNELTLKSDQLLQQVAAIEINTESQYSIYKRSKEDEVNITIESWKQEYSAISNRIKSLLPDALTAGLSSAYHDKKELEIKESKWLTIKFFVGIFGMMLVSTIPFAVSAYFIHTGKTIEQVINDIPRMASAVLPLYIPVLWLAYSANKSLNLSKRLIEEYTHKEVLSKTFEGLSRQIEDISDDGISTELRIRLLYNILEVNSENPGKLITDYNKADHPLMDALEHSVKLGVSLEKVADIPGISKIASILEKRTNKKLADKKRQIETGLDALSGDEDADPES